GGRTHDVRQIHVTWDARALYIAVDATCDGGAVLVLLDTGPGGSSGLSAQNEWRRGVRCGDVLRPDFLLAARDRDPRVELWRASGEPALERVADPDFDGRASFDGDARGRALEAAIPWNVLFPGAPVAVDSRPGAPPQPLFVLPAESSRDGLRLAA